MACSISRITIKSPRLLCEVMHVFVNKDSKDRRGCIVPGKYHKFGYENYPPYSHHVYFSPVVWMQSD
jgi:hypothetical protein